MVVEPRIFIIQENPDANTVLNGILWLKGCEPHKFTEGNEALNEIKKFDGKVDAVVISGKIAADRNLMLVVNIKKINYNINVLVIGDDESDKIRLMGYGTDEFTLRPMSPENVADKVLMLISREKVKENR
ncbi:MAG: hypothetical protein DA328_05360 [Nitrososphaeraceae archaeon]|nr:hypothetical protein [Nitrososphaeraceae archaeon]